MNRDRSRRYAIRGPALCTSVKPSKLALVYGTVASVLVGIVSAVVNPSLVSSQQSTAALVFDGATVVDVEQGKLVPDQRVVVIGSRIQAMGNSRMVQVPKNAQVVQAQGKYLIPGLWDMHVHPMEYAAEYFYPLFIANGLTGIRDAFSSLPLDTLLQWRREILAGTRVGPPRQIFSGAAINEGSGEEGVCKRTSLSGHVCVADSADARRLVNDLKAAGADMIKMYHLSKSMYFVIAAEARRIGIPFGGHLWPVSGPSALEASDSGASTIDHMNMSGMIDSLCILREASLEKCRPLAERMRRNGTWFVPTILPMRAYLGFDVSARTDTLFQRLVAMSDEWTSWAEGPVAGSDNPGLFSVMRGAGLPILAGTDIAPWDVGSMHGAERLSTELGIYGAEGLTPLEVLQTATLNPAKMFRATDSLGTVAPGKLADLVLLDADPLADVANITKIRAVVANGRYFDRAALDKLLSELP